MTAPMTVTVLGCATPYPRPGEPCSGYLVQADGATVWIDAGSGTLAALQTQIDVTDVDAVWISHLHPDHSSDLLNAWNLYVNADNPPRPVVAGPPGWTANADAFLGRPGAMHEVFDTVDLEDGHRLTVRCLTLTAYRTRHGVPTYGVRITAPDGAVLAYSADSAPCDALTELARDADLLIIETGATNGHPGHCTPEDAAKTATAAGARRILLTHLADGLSRDEAFARAAALCNRPLDVAEAGWRNTVRP
ncbi:MBL fold metallo-hydrolase [Yinghuangia sp. ASG 101]|uniref:MBL fold metallo-hydrolase n=1 Tax=Yinghuangia sp. ASG 101 TaxID=2896848 RepID=UPI001E554B12|nr:MBL fold metallo-hydrolase [Yinghuangia sp. ASG 101]UGQ10920.1 MBL fold metallo-hydrolase [Yinghuangia sp. ASG 101]